MLISKILDDNANKGKIVVLHEDMEAGWASDLFFKNMLRKCVYLGYERCANKQNFLETRYWFLELRTKEKFYGVNIPSYNVKTGRADFKFVLVKNDHRKRYIVEINILE